MSILTRISVTTSVLSVLIGCQSSSYPARWSRGSRDYKSEVLKAPTAVGELKHIEWDGWGWAGQDTTVYLVFDPTDSLSTIANKQNPGKIKGIPCEVFVVRPLESQWYTVQFYTNEFWGRHNELNCTGSNN